MPNCCVLKRNSPKAAMVSPHFLGPTAPNFGLYDKDECATSAKPRLNLQILPGQEMTFLVSSLVYWHRISIQCHLKDLR